MIYLTNNKKITWSLVIKNNSIDLPVHLAHNSIDLPVHLAKLPLGSAQERREGVIFHTDQMLISTREDLTAVSNIFITKIHCIYKGWM